MVKIFKNYIAFSGKNFENFFEKKRVFAVKLQKKIGKTYIFFISRSANLMTISCIFFTSDYAIAIKHSHLDVWMTLNQRCLTPKNLYLTSEKITTEQI